MTTGLAGRTAVALALCIPSTAGAQTMSGALLPLGPGLIGSTIFVAPRVDGRIGPVRAGATLRLEWGQVESRSGEGRLAVALTPGLDLLGRVQLSADAAHLRSYDDRAVSLAVTGRTWGVRAGYRGADAATGSFRTTVQSADVRTWIDLGLVIGLTARGSETLDHASDVLERRYVVAGYEFISREEFSYLRSTRYQDLELDVTGRLGPVRLTAVAGRGFSRDASPDREWAYLRLITRVLPRFELLAEAGRNPGLPAILEQPSSFVRVGLRIDVSAVPRPGPAVVLPPVADGDDEAAAHARVDVDARGAPELVVNAPGASTVEVRGDFTDWRTLPMHPAGTDVWALPVREGVLRFNLRLDGGEWIVPAGVAAVPDEFGSDVGVVVVVGD